METMPMDDTSTMSGYEVETDKIESLENSQGNYKLYFINADGKETTMQIGVANSPEFMGDSMVSSIDMVPDSSSDGRSYMVTGYYKKVPDGHGEYTLTKTLIKEN